MDQPGIIERNDLVSGHHTYNCKHGNGCWKAQFLPPGRCLHSHRTSVFRVISNVGSECSTTVESEMFRVPSMVYADLQPQELLHGHGSLQFQPSTTLFHPAFRVLGS